MNTNTLLTTDVYKLGHMLQYPPDTTEVYSYMEARKPDDVVFFGLQYYLKEYLTKEILFSDFEAVAKVHREVLGKVPNGVHQKWSALWQLGYWPIEICAVPEGTVVPGGNVLMTIRNTHPDFAWCVGYLESLLLKVWNPCTVATYSMKYRDLVNYYAMLTCDYMHHTPYAVHDFGYRGVSSEETAAISGAAHLLNFRGSDTLPAVKFLIDYYGATNDIAASVPASEHSVMCSYGRDQEFEAIDRLIFDVYPTGIVSIVADSYNLWDVLTTYVESRKERILARDGKVVFRPDSGDPVKIICGDESADLGSNEWKGAVHLLGDTFGFTKNSKGYWVLNEKVGLIYGDGMYYARFEEMLETLRQRGWASSNLVIGVGGLLLQQHSRDDLSFAIKATSVTTKSGGRREIYKDPITDPGKKSKKGYMKLVKDENGNYTTVDQQDTPDGGELVPVFRNGKILKEYSLNDIRSTVA